MALLYTLRQPQPPAKCIGFYGLCPSLYTRIRKIKLLTLMGFYGRMLIMIRNVIIDKDNKTAIYYCPKCEEFTSYDEWAQPQRACINCATSEE